MKALRATVAALAAARQHFRREQAAQRAASNFRHFRSSVRNRGRRPPAPPSQHAESGYFRVGSQLSHHFLEKKICSILVYGAHHRIHSNAKEFQMKYLAVPMLLLLLVIPSFAQSGVDNCCGVDGRACMTHDDWVDGYFAWQHQQCTGSHASSSSSAAGSDYYFWSGGVTAGWDTIGTALLTTGKWQIWPTGNHWGSIIGRRVWVRLTSTNGSECFKSNWVAEEGEFYFKWTPRWTNEAIYFGWNIPSYTNISARSNCSVSVAVKYAGDPDWRVRLKKVDDNI